MANAGILTSGPFVGNTLEAETAMINLNLVVPMQIADTRGHGSRLGTACSAAHDRLSTSS